MTVCSSGSGPSGSTGKAWIVHSLLIGAAVAAAVVAHGVFFRRLMRRGGYRSRVVGIIPARFASSRFQGKPLVPILGKPMIQRTWERAKMATTLDHVGFFAKSFLMPHLHSRLLFIASASRSLSGHSISQIFDVNLACIFEDEEFIRPLLHSIVATDDETIAKCCRGFGADVVMTSEACKNGTERCNEALEKLGKDYDVVVNIQGDEPLIEPEIIDGIVKSLQV